MERWKKILKIILIAVPAAFVLFFMIYAFFTWPVYHSFTKEVDSYDKLCAPFKDSNEIFLPDEDDIPTEGYILHMDGRSLFAKPVSYCINKTENRGDFSVRYQLNSSVKGGTPCKGTQEYHGVAYNVISEERQLENKPDYYGVYLLFDINKVYYRFDATYNTDTQSPEAAKATEEQLKAQLETYAKQVIDKYNASLD